MKYPKEAKLCCPNCNGNGYIIVYNRIYTNKKESMRIRNAIRIYKKEIAEKSISLRNIAKLVGLKHPQQVKHHIKMIEKIGWNNE